VQAAAWQRLKPGAVLTLRHCSGRSLRVHAGRLWITEPGDHRDHFVAAGESYTVRGNGATVLECVGPMSAAWSD
jgi:hypothetical protein